MSRYGPITGIEISDMGDPVGGRRPVTIKATGKTVLLPESVIQIKPHCVFIPIWLRDKLSRYLYQTPKPKDPP